MSTESMLDFTEYCIAFKSRLPTDMDLLGHSAKITPQELLTFLTDKSTINKLRVLGYTESHLYKLYTNHPDHRFDLHSLGILPDFPDSLNRDQLDTIALITDPTDPRPANRKLKELGIPNQMFNVWLQDPTFAQALAQSVRRTTEVSRLLALNSLSLKAAAGDNTSIMQISALLSAANLNRPTPPMPVTYRPPELPSDQGFQTQDRLDNKGF